ncbi:MAG: DNA polymerase III subunit delta' [Anaerolineae bacterium]
MMNAHTQPRDHWPVIGHGWAIEQLRRSLAHGRVRHAYLITGPASVGKTTLARAFAQALNCVGDRPPCGVCRPCRLIGQDVHPDVPVVQAEREGGALKIDQVRELQQSLALRPVEGRFRVPILLRFHEATPAAQDALLKTLEEPPPHVVMILTADRADALLPTITSRCQLLLLRALSFDETYRGLQEAFGVPPEAADRLARLSGGRIGWAVRAAQDPTLLEARAAALDQLEAILRADRVARFRYAAEVAKQPAALRDMLTLWQTYWRDVVLLASGSSVSLVNIDRLPALQAVAAHAGPERAADGLEAVSGALERLAQNANTRLTVEVLMLDLPEVATGRLEAASQ